VDECKPLLGGHDIAGHHIDRGIDRAGGRGLHSSTSQLNLSHF